MTMNTRSVAITERLAFNSGPKRVPGQRAIDAALARDAEPTFATAPYAEPRDWGYPVPFIIGTRLS